ATLRRERSPPGPTKERLPAPQVSIVSYRLPNISVFLFCGDYRPITNQYPRAQEKVSEILPGADRPTLWALPSLIRLGVTLMSLPVLGILFGQDRIVNEQKVLRIVLLGSLGVVE